MEPGTQKPTDNPDQYVNDFIQYISFFERSTFKLRCETVYYYYYYLFYFTNRDITYNIILPPTYNTNAT